MQPTRSRLVMLIAGVLAALALCVPSTASAKPVPGATYTGPVAGGGTVEFDVSADGKAITRFKASDVPGTYLGSTCTVTGGGTGHVSISNNAFSWGLTFGFTFSGSFPGAQQAQGVVNLIDGLCFTGDHKWTAATTTLPPPPPDRIPPALVLRYAKTQAAVRHGAVDVQVRCPTEACAVTASGRVAALKVYRLGSATSHLAKGGRTTLHLKLSQKARAGITSALRKHATVKAFLNIAAHDSARNFTMKARTIRIR